MKKCKSLLSMPVVPSANSIEFISRNRSLQDMSGTLENLNAPVQEGNIENIFIKKQSQKIRPPLFEIYVLEESEDNDNEGRGDENEGGEIHILQGYDSIHQNSHSLSHENSKDSVHQDSKDPTHSNPLHQKSSFFIEQVQPQVDVTNLCQICLENKKELKSFKCSHQFCRKCLSEWFQHQIKSYKEIICPNQECGSALLEQSELFLNLPTNVRLKYEDIKFRILVESNPTWRLCPDSQCKRGIVEIKINDKNAKCKTCRAVYCVNCMLREHKGECEGVEANLLKKRYRFRRCPGCNNIVERNQGCPHMTCRCKFQFCYGCGKAWDGSHYCLRNRIQGQFVTERLSESLKCMRPEQYEYNNSPIGYLLKVPYYLAFVLLMCLWVIWCILFGLLQLAGIIVIGMSLGYFVALAKCWQRSSSGLSLIGIICMIITLPVSFVVAGVLVVVCMLYESMWRYYLSPCLSGQLFPVLKCLLCIS